MRAETYQGSVVIQSVTSYGFGSARNGRCRALTNEPSYYTQAWGMYRSSKFWISHSWTSQTQSRRKDIIDSHHAGNPDFWGDVEDLLDSLGVDGISSDESENEGSMKKTRRVRKGWISPEVSNVWQEVESYHQKTKPRNQRGNMGLERHFAHHRTNIHRVVAGLPKNYYDNLWWQSLTASEQANLDPQPAQPLPDCTVYVIIQFTLSFFLTSHCFTPGLNKLYRRYCRMRFYLPLAFTDLSDGLLGWWWTEPLQYSSPICKIYQLPRASRHSLYRMAVVFSSLV